MLRDVSLRNTPPPEIRVGEQFTSALFLCPEQTSRMCVFLNKVFYREGLLALRPTPKLEDYPSLAARDRLFNLFACYPPYRRPFLYPQPEDAPCRGDWQLQEEIPAISFPKLNYR